MTNFVNLHGNDYPSMKLIYPALRGGVESGPEEPIEAAPQRLLLTLGSLGSRRNQLRSIKAFAQSKLADEGYCYVVRGGPEPGFGAVVEAAGKTPAVILPGLVNNNQLRWLYAHASRFVLPSLLEGVGSPAAKAISRGLVPLPRRGDALHEIAGDAAILVDRLNTDEIADGMLRRAHVRQAERQARLSALRKESRALLVECDGGGLARHVGACARAVIARATVFTRVSPRWRAKGCLGSFHLRGRGCSGSGILAGPRGRIARRHVRVAFPVPPGRAGAAR